MKKQKCELRPGSDHLWLTNINLWPYEMLIVTVFFICAGLAYGLLTGLRPIHGVYTDLFSSLIYFFLGTTKQLAVGNALYRIWCTVE